MGVGYKVTQANKTVTTAGTAEALSATDLWVSEIVIIPVSTNTGNVYIGDSDIDNTGPYFKPTGNWEYDGSNVRGTGKEINLAELYIDVDNDGEGVTWNYIIRR